MKSKNIIILLAILCIFCLSIAFSFKTIKIAKQREIVRQSFPVFNLSDLQGNLFTQDSLKRNVPTLFLYFDPECETCHSEFKQIKLNQNDFHTGQIIFFSTQPADTIIHFLNNIAFEPSPNMIFLVDDKADLLKTLEIKGPPTSLIYNKNSELIKRFDGPVKIETLIKYLSE